MYYVIELGWGRKTNGRYRTQCRAGVELLDDKICRIYGMHYLQRAGKRWFPNPKTVWGPQDPSSRITGALEKNRKVSLRHRSIDSVVKATVIAVYPASPPRKITSPLAH